MTSRITVRRALPVLALVMVGAGCASATQPALEVGDVSYSRAELDERVAENLGLGDDLPAVVSRDTYNPAINDLLNEGLIVDATAELEAAGGEVTDADRATVLENAGVGADFDLDSLDEANRKAAEDAFVITALQRVLAEQGRPWEDYLAELTASVRLDPRYGTFDVQQGVVPPAPPGIER